MATVFQTLFVDEPERREAMDRELRGLIEKHEDFYKLMRKIVEVELANIIARELDCGLGMANTRCGNYPAIDAEQLGLQRVYRKGFKDGLFYLFDEIDSRIAKLDRKVTKS